MARTPQPHQQPALGVAPGTEPAASFFQRRVSHQVRRPFWPRIAVRLAQVLHILYKVRSSPPRGTGLNAEPRAPPIGDRITLAPFVLRSDEKSEKSPGASSMAGPSEAVSRGVQPRSSDGQPRQHGCTAAAIGPLTKLPCRRPEKPLTLPASSQGIWATGPLVRDKSVDSARAQLFFRSAGQPRRPKRVCRRQPVINVCWSWL